jgi:hypothetical protein
MAKPIKETPILRGKDAEIFVATTSIDRVIRVDSDERARIRKNFASLQAIAKF